MHIDGCANLARVLEDVDVTQVDEMVSVRLDFACPEGHDGHVLAGALQRYVDMLKALNGAFCKVVTAAGGEELCRMHHAYSCFCDGLISLRAMVMSRSSVLELRVHLPAIMCMFKQDRRFGAMVVLKHNVVKHVVKSPGGHSYRISGVDLGTALNMLKRGEWTREWIFGSSDGLVATMNVSCGLSYREQQCICALTLLAK